MPTPPPIPLQVRQLLECGNDVNAFAMAAFKRGGAQIRAIHNRVRTRTGITSVEVEDADPGKAGKQRGRIQTLATSSDTAATLAARFVALAWFKGKGFLYVDEAARFMVGAPVGPRGLDLDSVEAPALNLDGEGSVDMSKLPRGLFGIDDAILIGVVVPLLIVALPFIIPMIIEWGKSAFAMIDGSGTPTGGSAEGPPVGGGGTGVFDPITGAFQDTLGGGDGNPDNDATSWAILGALVIAAVLLLKKAG